MREPLESPCEPQSGKHLLQRPQHHLSGQGIKPATRKGSAEMGLGNVHTVHRHPKGMVALTIDTSEHRQYLLAKRFKSLVRKFRGA